MLDLYHTSLFVHLLLSFNFTLNTPCIITWRGQSHHTKEHAIVQREICRLDDLRHVLVATKLVTMKLSERSGRYQSTFKNDESSHSPLSIGPRLPPSSSISLIFPADNFISFPESSALTPVDAVCRLSSLGAWTKHVKCKSVSKLVGTCVCPPPASSAWILAKSGVVSRCRARSTGVLSGKKSRNLLSLQLFVVVELASKNRRTFALFNKLGERASGYGGYVCLIDKR